MKTKTLTSLLAAFFLLSVCQAQSGLLLSGDTNYTTFRASSTANHSFSWQPNIAYQFDKNHQAGLSLAYSNSSLGVNDESSFQLTSIFYNYLHWLNDKVAIVGTAHYSDRNFLFGESAEIGLAGGLYCRLSSNLDLRLGIVQLPIYRSSTSTTNSSVFPGEREISSKNTRFSVLQSIGDVRLIWRPTKWTDGFDDLEETQFARRFVSVDYFSNASTTTITRDGQVTFSSFDNREINAELGLYAFKSYVVGLKAGYRVLDFSNELTTSISQNIEVLPMLRMMKPLASNLGYYADLYAGPSFRLNSDNQIDFIGGLDVGLLLNVYGNWSLKMELISLNATSYSPENGSIFTADLRIQDFGSNLGVNYSF